MTAETTHKATRELGPCVVNNELIWSSASGITTADPHSYGGCLRYWHYDQVGGLKEGSTDAQQRGTDLHASIEDYLLNNGPLTPLAMAGRHFIPPPQNPLVLVEFPIVQVENGRIAGMMLSARGKYKTIPIAGHVDIYDHRALYIDEEGNNVPELRTLEVKDWKTTSSFEYAKTARELGENIQVNTYAEAGLRAWPQYEHARMTHVYFRTRGAMESRLVTIRRSREEVARRWEYAESVVRTMEDAAREANPDRVDPNQKSCDAYRGCPHRGRCTAYHRSSLDAFYGKIASDVKGDIANALRQEGLQSSALSCAQGTLQGFGQGPATAPGLQAQTQREFQEPVSREPLKVHQPSETRLMVEAAPQVRDHPGAIPGATAFPERPLCDMPPSVRRDRHEVQSANVGTLPRDNAFSRRDMSELQFDDRTRERQSDRAAERGAIPERTLAMGLLQQNNILPQQPAAAQQAPDMRAQLAAEEAQLRAQQAAQQPAATPQSIADVMQRIMRHGRGYPALGGNAAQAYAAAGGQAVAPGTIYPGQMQLGSIRLDEVAHLFQLAGELDGAAAQPPAQPPQQVVQQAQQIVQQATTPPAQINYAAAPQQYTQPQVYQPQQTSILAPGAPESIPALAMAQPTPVQAPAGAPLYGDTVNTVQMPPAEVPARGRGRPKKNQNVSGTAPELAAPAAQIAAAPPAQPTPVQAGAATQVAPAAAPTYSIVEQTEAVPMIFIDCIPSVPFKTLREYIDRLNANLAQRYCVDAQGRPTVQDIRCAPKDSVLAFGGWKGALAECVRSMPPAPAAYYLDTRDSEIAQVVADALASLCESSGALCVRGVR